MKEIIEYTGLKTNTSFNFKNKKEQNEYWDKLLIESTLRYRNEFLKYLKELLHVYFSFSQIFKLFTIISIILMFVFMNNIPLMLFNGGLSAIFGFLVIYFHGKFNTLIDTIAITDALYTDEFLELLREEVIKLKK